MEATHACLLDEAPSAQELHHCTHEGCSGALVARGMCRKHYAAWWKRTPRGQRLPARNLKRRTPAERFAAKVDRRGPEECWPFTGSTADHKQGHGEFYVSPGRGKVPAHTFALELATGTPCPPGKEGCHHCDNPPCCNPEHIYYGTRRQNVDDKVARGRHPRGEQSSAARLTEGHVIAIRTRFAGGAKQAELAAEYGIHDSTVSMIVTGRRWAHVGGPIHPNNRRGVIDPIGEA